MGGCRRMSAGALAVALTVALSGCAAGPQETAGRTSQPLEGPSPAPSVPSAAASPAVRTFALKVGPTSLVSGPTLLEVRQGEAVLLMLDSTTPAEETLLVQGYEQRGELEAGESTQLSFVADVVGDFRLVREESAAELAVLRVTP